MTSEACEQVNAEELAIAASGIECANAGLARDAALPVRRKQTDIRECTSCGRGRGRWQIWASG